MSDEIKFTEEEMNSLKALQESFNNAILKFGQLKIEKLNQEKAIKGLEAAEVTALSEFETLVASEKSLAEELNKKYGAGTLDPTTGIFTPTSK